MTKSKKLVRPLQLLSLVIITFFLSSCDRGLEIISIEVSKLPYRMVYIAGIIMYDMESGR